MTAAKQISPAAMVGRPIVVRLAYLDGRGRISLEGMVRGVVAAADPRRGLMVAMRSGDRLRLPAGLPVTEAAPAGGGDLGPPLLEARWAVAGPAAAAFWRRFGRR